VWLADTSIWVDHFRHGRSDLADRLSEGSVLIHPGVFGELACGNLKHRATVMSDLAKLPTATLATDAEVLHLIEKRMLWGRGIGWIDAHLLTSALLSQCWLWTSDRRLAKAADDLGIG
jgi:predicted nucleic acid-binding protein